jgi:small basic protein
MPQLRCFDSRKFVCWLIIAWALGFTYSPVLRSEYALADDYTYFFSSSPSEQIYLADGRPLYAIAQVFVHSSIHSLSQLTYLRFIAVVCSIGIAIVFFEVTSHLRGGRIERMAFAIALGTLPCLHDVIGMALLWLVPLAGVCAVCACVLTFCHFDCERTFKQRFPQLAFALLLMLVANMIYQPMISLYWSVALVFTLDRRFLSSRAYQSRVLKLILYGVAYFAVCFLAFKLVFMLSGVTPKARTALATNPLEKLYWFLRIQLPIALNYWQLVVAGSRWWPLLTATSASLLIMIGYSLSTWRYCRKTMTSTSLTERRNVVLVQSLLIVALVLLSHVHWLAIKDLPQSYRILVPLGVSAWVLLYWGVRQIATVILNSRFGQTVNRTAILGVAATSMIVCQHYSEAYLVTSYSLAHRYILFCLRDGLQPETKTIHVICQGPDDGLVPDYYIESFGRPPSEARWMIQDWLALALRECGIQNQVEMITHGGSDDLVPTDSNTLIIDMRKLVNFRI